MIFHIFNLENVDFLNIKNPSLDKTLISKVLIIPLKWKTKQIPGQTRLFHSILMDNIPHCELTGVTRTVLITKGQVFGFLLNFMAYFVHRCTANLFNSSLCNKSCLGKLRFNFPSFRFWSRIISRCI